jgi:hypothetical protein
MDSCLQQTLEEIKKATAGMSAEQLAWHPEGKWSSAEILEHLTLAFAGTAKGMQRALASNGNATVKRSLKNRALAFVVADLGYMPSGRKAPKGTVPQGNNGVNAVEKIVATLIEMDGALAEVERKKGTKTLLQHPILGPLTVRQWRKFHLVHTKHHMRQIRTLRELAS